MLIKNDIFLKKNIFYRPRLLLYFLIVFCGFLLFSCTNELNETSTSNHSTEKDSILQNKIKKLKTSSPNNIAAYAEVVSYSRKYSKDIVMHNGLLYQYGSTLIYNGRYNEAIEILSELLNNNPDEVLKARTYMLFGILHFFQKNWDDALYYYKKTKKIVSKVNNIQGMSIAENNIANIYQKKGEYEKAIKGYQKCIALQEQLQDTATICNSYFNIGSCYEELNKNAVASSFFTQSYNMAKSINDVEIMALSQIRQAKLYLVKNNYNEAEKLLAGAEALSLSSGYRQILVELYDIKKQLYEQKGDYKTALTFYKRHQKLSDSIINQELKQTSENLKIKLKTQEKEQEIILQKTKVNNINKLLWILGIFSFIGSVFTIVIYRLWKMRSTQNTKLKQLNQTKDKLFSIISHDLKAPAIAQKMAIDEIVERVDRLDDNILKSSCSILQESAENQITIIDNLLNWTRLQTNKLRYNPQAIDLIPLIKGEIKLYKIAIMQKSIILKEEMPIPCIVYADRQMITIVVRNLINNAVKFTNEGGTVTVMCKESVSNNIIVSIIDNGVGMKEEQIANLYTKEQNIEINFGTRGEKGTGLGLILCKELLERNNSRLIIESEKDKGTKMQFTMQKM